MPRLLLVLLLASCLGCAQPSTDDASAVLSDTASKLGEITSGTLDLRFETSIKGEDPSGFEVSGPFSLESKGELPVAELEHTRFDGDAEERSGTFVSTGTDAFVVRDDKSTRVPTSQITASGLTDLVRRDSDDPGLGRLDISDWITATPEVSGGGRVGGVDTDKVTATLDTPRVVNGLIDLARSLGGGAARQLQPVPSGEMDRVRRAATKAQLEIWSGKDDRLLRRLVLEMVFSLRGDLAEKLDQLSGATIRLDASIGDLNEPVTVEAPR